MLDIRRVLYATDFSPVAERALPRALAMAERHGAELHVLHVIVLHALEGADLAPLHRRLEDQARRRLEAVPGPELSGPVRIVPAVTRAISAPPAILEYAAENDVDLIVMGSHGRRGLRRLLLGSVAEEVLRLAPAPVLIVRDGADGRAEEDGFPARILVPVDFSSHSMAACAVGRALAATFDADLFFVHVIERTRYPDFYLPVSSSGLELAELRQRAAEAMARLCGPADAGTGAGGEEEDGPRAAGVVRIGRPVPRILELAETRSVDLIVMASHGLHGLERALIGSTTEGVIRHAPCSVLVVKVHGRGLREAEGGARPVERAAGPAGRGARRARGAGDGEWRADDRRRRARACRERSMSRGSSPPVEDAETASWINHLGRDVPGNLPTLAIAEAGQCVRVTAFLSETVRHRCAELGIREGDLMVCRDQTPGAVTLELPEGHSIALERPGAALVQVERLGRRECVRPPVGARAGAGPRRRRSGATHPR